MVRKQLPGDKLLKNLGDCWFGGVGGWRAKGGGVENRKPAGVAIPIWLPLAKTINKNSSLGRHQKDKTCARSLPFLHKTC